MARTVSKSLASATVYVFDPSTEFELDENGMPKPNRNFKLDGNPSANVARIQAQKLYGKNVLVCSVEVDETKLSVAPSVFIANSDICKEGESYGREYVTQTFKITEISGFYIGTEGMTKFEYEFAGETTQNKLLNMICDKYQTRNAVITSSTVKDERRYMTRDKYLELAQ